MNWKTFETYISEKMVDDNIAGVAVAVSKNDEIIYAKGFGYRDVENKKIVTKETIFGIASITKSFTALAIMMLEDQGILSVEDPVIKYIPEFKIGGIDDMSEIKIYHLLSHTTGLAPMKRKEELNKLSEHLRYFSSQEHEILGKPGEYYSYCNDTFLLLGIIIERLTGKLFRKHITEVILNELDMNRSTMSLEELEKFDNVSVPYDHNEEKELMAKPWPTLGNYEVGGGIRSNVLDLLKYGALYINHGIKEEKILIRDEHLKKMWHNTFKIIEQNYYGYALKVTPNYNGMTLVEHGGGQTGVSSNFGFIPEAGLVVSVLCNVSGVDVGDIWIKAVNTALMLPMDQKRIELKENQIPNDLEKYCGTYRSLEGTSLHIKIEDHELKLIQNKKTKTLKSCNETIFLIEKSTKPICFYFKDNGTAWAVLYGARMLTRVNSNDEI